MRKLLALVATMAMVLSMFTGIAFAAENVPGTVLLDNDMVNFTNKDTDALVVSGKILNQDKALIQTDFVVNVKNSADAVIATTIARGGVFSTTIPGTTPVGAYTVEAAATGYAITADTLNVTYKLTSPDTLGFTWGQTGNFIYEGTLTGVTAGYVRIVNAAGAQVGTQATVIGGKFYFFMDKALFTVPGEVSIQYTTVSNDYDAAVLLAKGTIAAATAPFAVSPATVLYSLTQNVSFKVTTTNLKVTGATYHYYIVPVGTALKDLATKAIYTFEGGSVDEDYTVGITPDKSELGSYTAWAVVKVGGQNAYTAQQNFTVGRPDSVNLIGLTTKMAVGDTYNLAGVQVVKIDRYGNVIPATKYDLKAVGAGVDLTGTSMASLNANLIPTQGGTINLTITAYIGTTKIGTFTPSITVTGGVATMTPTTMEVGQTGTITVTVKDENNLPVNNAVISFKDETNAVVATIDSRFASPVNGAYTLSVKADTFALGTYTVEVERYVQDTTPAGFHMQYIAKAPNLVITGKNVYTVSTDIANGLLAGEDALVVVTVKNGTTFVNPVSLEIYDSENNKVDTIACAGLTKVDTNGDGILDSYKVPVDAITYADTFKLVASTDSGEKIGSTTFEVVLPVLNISVDKVTNNVNSTFTFTVVDPRDNSVLDWNVTVGAAFATIDEASEFEYDMVIDGNEVVPAPVDEPYQLTLLVAEADYDLAEDYETVPHLYFAVEGDGFVVVALDEIVPVAEASFTVDPATVVSGTANNLTFTLVDANGAALEGYKVFRGESKIGETDANGQVAYPIAEIGTTPIEFNVELDYTWTAGDPPVGYVAVKTATVKPGIDNVAPVVSAPATVDTNTAVITITDNVRVIRVKINGVEDTGFFPGTSYEKTVTLVPGANTFVVEAMDNNYNTVKQTVTINYNAKAVTLQGTSVQRKGENLFVEIRKFEELGAKLTWNGTTKTATFTYGTQTVSVTIGSTTATVNGVAKSMPAAPFLSNGRTLVPTRFISEALGWDVKWVPGDIVTITLP